MKERRSSPVFRGATTGTGSLDPTCIRGGSGRPSQGPAHTGGLRAAGSLHARFSLQTFFGCSGASRESQRLYIRNVPGERNGSVRADTGPRGLSCSLRARPGEGLRQSLGTVLARSSDMIDGEGLLCCSHSDQFSLNTKADADIVTKLDVSHMVWRNQVESVKRVIAFLCGW